MIVKTKKKVNSLRILTFFIIFSFCLGNQLFGQEKVNISAGFGFPELINLGVRYQIKQIQIGMSVGTYPVKDEELMTISTSADIYYHFGGFSELSSRRPWYGRIGLNYLFYETKTFIDKSIGLGLRIGRDFNISKKIGIEIDTGVFSELYFDRKGKYPYEYDYNPGFNIYPSFGIELFYRL